LTNQDHVEIYLNAPSRIKEILNARASANGELLICFDLFVCEYVCVILDSIVKALAGIDTAAFNRAT